MGGRDARTASGAPHPLEQTQGERKDLNRGRLATKIEVSAERADVAIA